MYTYLPHRLVLLSNHIMISKDVYWKVDFIFTLHHSMKIKNEILKMNIWNKQDSSQPGEISCKVAHLVLLRDVEQVSIWQVGFTQLGGQVTDHCVSFIYKVQSWTETHYLSQYNLKPWRMLVVFFISIFKWIYRADIYTVLIIWTHFNFPQTRFSHQNDFYIVAADL